jgi:hypothetical protein
MQRFIQRFVHGPHGGSKGENNKSLSSLRHAEAGHVDGPSVDPVSERVKVRQGCRNGPSLVALDARYIFDQNCSRPQNFDRPPHPHVERVARIRVPRSVVQVGEPLAGWAAHQEIESFQSSPNCSLVSRKWCTEAAVKQILRAPYDQLFRPEVFGERFGSRSVDFQCEVNIE